MEILVQHIETAIKIERHCFVRPDQLQRIWPDIGEEEREGAVRDFARQHGWRVFSYGRALGVMFLAVTTTP